MKLIDENRYADEMREMVLPALATCRSEGWMAPADDDGLPPLQRAGKLHYVCYDAAKFDRLGEDGAAATFRGAVVISHGFTEFAAKYAEMVWYFLLAGYSVCVFEHRGHGYSARDVDNSSLVWIDDWQRYVASVNRIALYPVANYGSAMTPFYTVLSIWVGAIILVAMMKVSVSDREKAKVLGLGETLPMGETMGVKDAVIAGRTAGPGAMLDVLRKPRPESPGNARRFGLHPYQEYFGRYAIFGAMALLQGTLVCLGDMFFLGVQCEHPLQFLMVGWLCALVFSLLIYTLTVSFGDIGKAIAVVLLVMQVAGSGGTFPIETLPPFFQTICKWLLFPYGVDAMHSAMAGSFGNEYWVSMGKLALFILPALLLGLVLRKPVMRLNDWIIRNLESTKVM